MFDPAAIAEDACADGHLDVDPIYQVLLTLGQKAATGRLTIADAAGDNHMFFMQGRPVGVRLAEHFHPLGQLLLELGRLNGATFLRAQRLIAEGEPCLPAGIVLFGDGIRRDEGSSPSAVLG